MKKSVIALISGAVGMVIGAGASYIYLKDRFQKEYDRKLSAEMLEFSNEYRKSVNKTVEKVEAPAEPEEVMNDEPVNTVSATVEHEKVDTHKTAYHKYKDLAKEYTEEAEEEDEEWVREANVPSLSENDAEPYIITESQHYNTKQAYDFVELTYDVISEDLFDADGEVVDDLMETVGIDNFVYFKESSLDEIYIRNEGWATDYVIHKEMCN